MSDIFLSYNREDAAKAKRFADGFAAEGLSVWWNATLRSGEAYDEVTEAALRGAKAVVVLWSPRSVVSRWVRAEATIADRCKTLVPVMIEPCERPIMFELTQTAELSHWTGDTGDVAWREFLTDVRHRVGIQTAPQVAQPQADRAKIQTAAKPSVLILPFVNMSGDAEQEYFSDGVTEDIITDLGRVSALSLISRNMAFSLKGKTVATAQLAETLHVTHILEGSVRKSGDRVRITAQLMDAATDTQVWAERFDRTFDDIFAIQDDISKAVVAALKLHLAPDEKRAIERRPTSNPEAYELFLMARQFGRTGSERMKPLIIRLCQRAVEIDPDFALAWAHMSFAEAELSQRNVVGGFSIEGALASAERALRVDPNLAEAHAAMGEALLRGANKDLGVGEPYIITALRLDPDCFEANLFAGYVYISQHRWEKAVHYLEIACTLDRDAYRPAAMVVQAYNGLGDRDNGLAAARRALALCEKILAIEPDHGGALGFFVTSLVDLGEADRAREWTRRAVLFDPDNTRLHYNLGCAMAALGDADAACDLLDGVIDKVNASWLLWMVTDNSLDPIRDHPRFVALMAKASERQKLLAS